MGFLFGLADVQSTPLQYNTQNSAEFRALRKTCAPITRQNGCDILVGSDAPVAPEDFVMFKGATRASLSTLLFITQAKTCLHRPVYKVLHVYTGRHIMHCVQNVMGIDPCDQRIITKAAANGRRCSATFSAFLNRDYRERS